MLVLSKTRLCAFASSKMDSGAALAHWRYLEYKEGADNLHKAGTVENRGTTGYLEDLDRIIWVNPRANSWILAKIFAAQTLVKENIQRTLYIPIAHMTQYIIWLKRKMH